MLLRVFREVKVSCMVEKKDVLDGTKRDIIQELLGGLARWDAKHYLHIAEFGYSWESELAFFPLFPAVLKISGTFFKYVFGSMSLNSAMILGGVLVNNVSRVCHF